MRYGLPTYAPFGRVCTRDRRPSTSADVLFRGCEPGDTARRASPLITETTVRPAAERLVVAATMGPTIHDTHAWRFRTRPGVVEVHADPARFRTLEDPTGRCLRLGCGAALVNLRLAAAQLGRESVLRLLPDPGRPMLLATLRLCGPHRTTPIERALYAATMRSFPAHRPYSDRRPPEPILIELAEAARLEGATLRYVLGDSAAATAVVGTRGDSPAEWLRAGQALQRIMLHAAVRTVSASFRYEVIDTAVASAALDHGDIPQVVLRLARSAPSARPVPSR